MKKLNFDGLRDDELVNNFVDAAKKMGAAVLDSEVRQANRMYDVLRAIDGVLRSRGEPARLKLLPLLEHKDRFVRYYAAKKLLGPVPDRARAVIEWNYKYWFDALAGDAGMTLHNLDTGFYKPD
jgi:Domain of unknown function (DUF2019)